MMPVAHAREKDRIQPAGAGKSAAAAPARRGPAGVAFVRLQARERGRPSHLASEEEQKKRDEGFREAQKKNPNAVGIRAEWIYEYDATRCRERFGKEATTVAG